MAEEESLGGWHGVPKMYYFQGGIVLEGSEEPLYRMRPGLNLTCILTTKEEVREYATWHVFKGDEGLANLPNEHAVALDSSVLPTDEVRRRIFFQSIDTRVVSGGTIIVQNNKANDAISNELETLFGLPTRRISYTDDATGIRGEVVVYQKPKPI